MKGVCDQGPLWVREVLLLFANLFVPEARVLNASCYQSAHTAMFCVLSGRHPVTRLT